MNKLKAFLSKNKSKSTISNSSGRKLTEQNSCFGATAQVSRADVERAGPSADTLRSYDAALNRKKAQTSAANVDWGKKAMEARLKREKEEALRENKEMLSIQKEISENCEPTVVEQKVTYFRVLDDSTVEGSYAEVETAIEEYLLQLLPREPQVAASTIIHSCNNKAKVGPFIDTVKKYISNIAEHPEDEKYKKIRKGNRVYAEKVMPVKGCEEFMRVAGFIEQELPFSDGTDMFWIFVGDIEDATLCTEILTCAEPLKPQLDRCLKIWTPDSLPEEELPDEFFELSLEELQTCQKLKTEEVDRNQILMTKATRQKLRCHDNRKYKFTSIRVRFPDDKVMQATFRAKETLRDVACAVEEHLSDPQRLFTLTNRIATSSCPMDETKTLDELQLVPSGVLLLRWDNNLPSNFEN